MEGALSQLHNLEVSNWLVGAGAALFFYDWLLCLDDEIQYLLRSHWGIGKVLFVCHRYPMMLLVVLSLYGNIKMAGSNPPELCRLYYIGTTYAEIVLYSIVQATQILRVHALYNRSLRVLVVLLALCFATSTSMLVQFSIWTRPITYYPNPLAPYINLCYIDAPDSSKWSTYMYLPPLLLDTIILVAIVYRSYNTLGIHRRATPTIRLLFRDGIVYFFVIFGVFLANLLIMALAPYSMSLWFVPFMRPLISSMGARIVFNLHSELRPERFYHSECTAPRSVTLPVFNHNTWGSNVETLEGPPGDAVPMKAFNVDVKSLSSSISKV